MNIGHRIKSLRKYQGLTQKELAEKVHKSPQVISNWERGYTPNITNEDIVNLATALNVKVSDIVSSSNDDTRADLPPLTPRDERDIAKDLEKMLAELDTSAAFGGNLTPDGEDLELLKSSLTQAMTLAKRVAKQKFTPKKYRKE
ncbi:helix-turn-helix domain-containing protein [Anaerovibrio slackiae]|uniref:helix-turn-helix domain-containing protein n=1 Tax=Anaerovibrio slackiae TaxID=2652309 RepID=UPI00386771AF